MSRRTILFLIFIMAVPLAATTLFYDDFSSEYHTPWTIKDIAPVINGPSAWDTISGAYWQTTKIFTSDTTRRLCTGTRAINGDTTWTNYAVNLQVSSGTPYGVGICFRYTDSLHYYRYYMEPNSYVGVNHRRLEKRSGSSVIFLDSLTTSYSYPTGFFTLSIWANGDSLTVFDEGVPILGARDAAYSHGTIALDCSYDSAAAFANVKVTTEMIADTSATPEATTGGRIKVGPYLQSPTSNSMIVAWHAESLSLGTVHYGLTPAFGSTITPAAPCTLCSVNITGLTPQTQYYYSLQVGDSTVSGTQYTLSTNRNAGSNWRLAVYGDTRTSPTEHRIIANDIDAQHPDLVVHVGDLCINGNYQDSLTREWLAPGANLFRHAPQYVAIGNHEHNSPQTYAALHQPGSDYFAVTYGCVRLIVLNDNLSVSPGSAQYTWFSAELASAATHAAHYVMVYFHHPPYTKGGTPNSNNRTYLVPLMESSGVVNFVLSGHVHDYERGLKNGINYIITGGGGAPLSSTCSGSDPYMTTCDGIYNYTIWDFSCTGVSFHAYNAANAVIDSFRMGTPVGVDEDLSTRTSSLNMTINPMPIRDAATVHITLQHNAVVDLTCFDVSGRVVDRVLSGPLTAGDHEAMLDPEEMTEGVYWLRLTTPEETLTKRIVVTH